MRSGDFEDVGGVSQYTLTSENFGFYGAVIQAVTGMQLS